ncbi:DNA topoisomerase IV, alpha subunit [Dissoconium aciculare CBS 342.82]|uniref:DNA topoisomerase (ATP-hydrolyzing) n=1 Tax=Dissoconium aciculare CBS 342.82 TaxID=1314786 RepID=A0A6J3M543_9PEZI|nr:DNA topoisomerase IV, alpha subunit [Dissoconium aciculare CBS 342.82]KAF1822629.1 DNA topoisomerase IV, alpha subunit [Dissoconium aciculare CBS 342.82]
MFEQIVDDLLNERSEISITLRTRPRSQATVLARDLQQITTTTVAAHATKKLSFPGKTADEAWRFSVVLRILQIMHEALRNDVVLSKRDVYYRDPALFGNQNIVDRYVDDIALTFGMTRSSLNVTAAAKGLIAGAAKFYKRDGSITTLALYESTLIFDPKDLFSVDMTHTRWILVIEKEATFRSLLNSPFWRSASSQGILLTGKGYPDLSTRRLLNFMGIPSMRNGFLAIPVYGLVDFDPDGLSILSTYQHGSLALAHENAEHTVPGMQWLGLRSIHLQDVIGHVHAEQELLALTARDRGMARRMLDREISREGSGAHHERQQTCPRTELQRMLMLNFKAELQVLDAIPEGVENLLAPLLRAFVA